MTVRRVSAALQLVLPLVLATALALAMLAAPRAGTTQDAPTLELRSKQLPSAQLTTFTLNVCFCLTAAQAEADMVKALSLGEIGGFQEFSDLEDRADADAAGDRARLRLVDAGLRRRRDHPDRVEPGPLPAARRPDHQGARPRRRQHARALHQRRPAARDRDRQGLRDHQHPHDRPGVVRRPADRPQAHPLPAAAHQDAARRDHLALRLDRARLRDGRPQRELPRRPGPAERGPADPDARRPRQLRHAADRLARRHVAARLRHDREGGRRPPAAEVADRVRLQLRPRRGRLRLRHRRPVRHRRRLQPARRAPPTRSARSSPGPCARSATPSPGPGSASRPSASTTPSWPTRCSRPTSVA